MANGDLVSVVIPTYNSEKTIVRAIRSALLQSYRNIELIIVDDASTDSTPIILREIRDKRLKIIRHKNNLGKNTGGSAARNTGLRLAKGKYIALLDSDDEWDSKKIEKQVDRIKTKGNGYKVSSCWINQIRNGSKYVSKYSKEGDISLDILKMDVSLAFGSSILFDRIVLEKVGYFDENFLRHQDYEYLLRILRKFKICIVEYPLVTIHGQSRLPSGELLVKTKETFLKKFESLIKSYGSSDRNHIYARNWLQVARCYASEGNIKSTFRYLYKSLSYKLLFSKKFMIIPFETYWILPILLIKSLARHEKMHPIF